MSKQYRIEKITDIFDIPEDRFDDFLEDFKTYYQQGNAWPELLENIAKVGGMDAKVLIGPMVWIDDDKHNIRVKISAEESQS